MNGQIGVNRASFEEVGAISTPLRIGHPRLHCHLSEPCRRSHGPASQRYRAQAFKQTASDSSANGREPLRLGRWGDGSGFKNINRRRFEKDAQEPADRLRVRSSKGSDASRARGLGIPEMLTKSEAQHAVKALVSTARASSSRRSSSTRIEHTRSVVGQNVSGRILETPSHPVRTCRRGLNGGPCPVRPRHTAKAGNRGV